MGDINRGPIFATFIKKQFPKIKTILCVADGKGMVARSLANKGFVVKVIEPKPRLEGNTHKNIIYKKGYFTRIHSIEEDIIVAMHPDEATIEVIKAATKQKKPFAIVPCCRKAMNPKEIPNGGFNEWINYLKKIAEIDVQEKYLKMNGKNLVLFKKEY